MTRSSWPTQSPTRGRLREDCLTKEMCTPKPRCLPLHSRHMNVPYDTVAHCGFLPLQSTQTCAMSDWDRNHWLEDNCSDGAQPRPNCDDRSRTLLSGRDCSSRRILRVSALAIVQWRSLAVEKPEPMADLIGSDCFLLQADCLPEAPLYQGARPAVCLKP